MLLKFTNPRLNLSGSLIWVHGKLELGPRSERFILFDEFDCLHLLFDSSACATRHHEAQARFENGKLKGCGSGRVSSRLPQPITSYH